jgi:phosphotransferase system enzyme I (PtsI)
LDGVAVFKGIGIGKAYNHKKAEVNISTEKIKPNEVDAVLEEFQQAKLQRIKKLEEQKEHVAKTVGEEESLIFEAHIEILNDPELNDQIVNLIKNDQMNLVQAIDRTRNQFVALFAQLDDPYIKERSKDIEDVTNGMINALLGVEEDQLSKINQDTVIFAKDLNPSETIQLGEYVQGIVLEDGSVTSHTAIVAKAKGIPTLVGYTKERPNDGEIVVLDGHTARVFVLPEELLLKEYKKKRDKEIQRNIELKKIRDKEAITKDGHKIHLVGNVGSELEAEAVVENGGFGVGLLRTEFIYMDSRHWPTEEEQFTAYSAIARKAGGDVIIRTLDIGGDKTLPYYTFPKEDNPFLGLRAIRFCLKNHGIFKTQLRAILRTSAKYPVKIMFPMISGVDEFLKAKDILDEVMQEMDAEKIAYNKKIQVGIMVEIPSVVYVMDKFVEHIDFVSIGTNDLCQYTLAVDRLNPAVSYIYDGMNMSILRMIRHVVEACHQADVMVGVCGELAGELESSMVLIGLGVDELSVSASMIPIIKESILKSEFKSLEKNAFDKIR